MKIKSLCMAAVAVFFISSGLVAADPVNKKTDIIKGCGTKNPGPRFRVIGFKDYPPFSWTELNERLYKDTGVKVYTYHGFILDSLKQSFNDLQIKYISDLAFDNFNDALKAMLRGNADFLFTGYYIDEAKSGMDYIYPAYFGNPFIVLSRKTKKINIDDLSELKGLKGVVRREEEVESLIRGLLPTDTKLEVVDGAEKAFRMLLSGDADFMITSPYAAYAESKRFKIRDKLHFGTKVVRHVKYFMAFSKMSPCRQYKDMFTKQINERFQNKAEIEKLLHKYIDIWAEMHADQPPLEYTPAVDEPVSAEGQSKQPIS